MNLQRLWSWLVGFLVIRINGDSLEKFINMAASRGILIWDIRRLQGNSMLVRVRLSALRPLRHIRRRVGCRVKVVDKRGLPFYFWQMRRRKLLTVGAIMFLLTIYLLSSFVWFIDITGNKQVAKADILKALRSEGIREGVWRHSLDLKGAEKRLTGKVPDLAWAGLEMHGTRVEVKVVEKVLPPAKESQKPADIVARCEGLVDQVLVMTGEAVVKSGDMVKPGQKLISGMIQTPEGPGGVNNQVTEDGEIIPLLPRQVSARGIVRARTWHQGYGEVTVTESGYKPSGVIVTRTSIKWRKGEIIIKGPKSSPFQHSRQVVTRKKAPSWRNYIIPVEIVNTEFHEMIPFTINRGVEAARQLAREKAVNQLKQQVSPQAEVLKEQVEETSDPTDNLIQLRITWETMEDIGIVKYWPESN